jgi:DNA-binding HxlR family transcriptional regulator
MTQYNVYSANCPTRQALSRISSKWTLLIIGLLGRQPHRFSELLASIDGISQKMLTQTLRSLERDGLVDRKIDASAVPISVTYSLTPIGQELIKPVRAIREWSETYIEEITTAQERYELRLAHNNDNAVTLS